MSSIPEHFDTNELAALCDALVDGNMTDQERGRLGEFLRSSDEARQFYLRYVGLSASMLELAADTAFSMPRSNSTAVPVARSVARSWRISKAAWGLIGLAAAAVVFAIVLNRPSDNDNDASEEFAAQITGLQDCIWTDAKFSPALGDQLPHGQQLRLQSGMVEVTFDSGTQVTLEGPAALVLNSAWEATLERGKLRAEVPAEAIGFAVQSATVDVVDLGTEFGMTVDPAGATDVCVLQGTVEATPREITKEKPAKFVIKKDNARRFNRNNSEVIENAELVAAQFKKPARLQRLARLARHVHWSFDEADGRVARADGTWLTDADLGAQIETSSSVQQNEPRIGGRFSGALRFDGNLHAHAMVPGFSDRIAHTVSFWIRVPSDTPLTESGPVISWLAEAQDPAHVQAVQIGWNNNPAQGPTGGLRTEIGRITAVGGTNLRDGQWHHVAVVIVPRNAGKVRWQFRQYVDGRLEESPTRTVKKARVDAFDEPADDVVWIGRQPKSLGGTSANFRGDLDELYIADRVLMPQQIAQLSKRNVLVASPIGVDE